MNTTGKLEENYIKRQRRQKAETTKIITEMRAALPDYTLDEIRQYKLAYHEALLMGLEEKGFVCTAEFVKQLLEYQHNLRAKAGAQSKIWIRPQLIYSKNELNILIDGLVKSEEYHNAERYGSQCEEFLKLAVYFAFVHEDWWWLGEQLLIQSVSVSTEYTFLGAKYEALSRFAYGKYLIENVKDYDTATEQLNIVLKLSDGTKWTTHIVFPQQTELLIVQTSYLLYICLIHETQKLMTRMDYKAACKLAIQARKRATESCFKDGETRALLLKGICELNMSQPEIAIKSFSRAYYIQEKIGSNEGVCEARIQLAKAYLMNGNKHDSLKTLMILRENAASFNLLYYVAQSYWHLGEFHLNNGEPQKATPLLGEALTIFIDGNYIRESEQVRNLEAISSGLEMFPKYLLLLSRTDKPNIGLPNLLKLVDWKDLRKEFWDNEPNIDSCSVDDLIDENVSLVSKKDEEIKVVEYINEDDNKDIVQLHVNPGSFRPASTTILDNEEEEVLVDAKSL
ncbi:hypothetical protein NQ314_008328 [Rhamnusium bicolor]|uniref:Tetratricopeptide repeat protein 29 n=1 Tax=Rhamnusium bicolor TaxID=1586634 RepID=A0AAV8YCM7_9CUCU|nr:hypothetical protein NQ314_008328 [Rhamnusium bicolor]